MIQSIKLAKGVVYVDLEKKCIARAPTASNLLQYGADNSLYFGIEGKSPLEIPLKKILGAERLSDMNQSTFTFNCYGQKARLLFNINAQRQIQLKFESKNLFECFSDYMFYKSEKLNPNDYLLVLNFANNHMTFKKKSDLELA